MDEELIQAIDRVLSLSGGDPVKATTALNERIETHRNPSATPSTVSSLTITTTPNAFSSSLSPSTVSSPRLTTTPGRSSSTVSSPTLTTTPSKSPLRISPPQISASPTPGGTYRNIRPGVFKPRGPFDTPKQHSVKPQKHVYPLPSPIRTSPPSPKRALPTNTAHTKTVPTTYIEIQSDSEEGSCVVVARRNFPSEGSSISNNHEGTYNAAEPADGTNDPGYSVLLPPSLAAIRPEDSSLEFQTFHELRRSIAADPLYLGEPAHISLRRPAGSATKRRMHIPPLDAPSSGRWYAVSCGMEVGVFLNWLIVAPLVNGKRAAVHKSFNRSSEAYLWLQAALLRGTVEVINE